MKADYSKADWSKTNAGIATSLNISTQAVQGYRNRRGIPNARSAPDWEALDWTKSNNRLSVETGYARSYIAEKRWRLKKGNAESPYEKLPAWAEAKLSERKTVHQWLDQKGIPQEENGKPVCLLRRLAIALKIHD